MGNAIRKTMDVRNALYIFGICGIASVLLDFDHALKILFFPNQGWRFLHIPVFIACCIMFCCLCAYLCGLYIRNILREIR